MDIEKSMVDKVVSLSDQEFRDKLEKAISAMGLDPRYAVRIAKDIPKLKKTLSGLSEKELKALSSSMDKEQLEVIKGEIDKIN